MSVELLITEHLDLWTRVVKSKSAGGRARNGEVETTGIKKLRELILELAVRGKLVAQHDSDEPAQTLLKRITEKKARLQADGQIKKTKELPAVSEDEARFDIPSNWIWTRLGTIAQISPRNRAEDQTEVSFIPMPLITTSHTGGHSQEKRQWSAIKKGYTHFADGDIALAKITPCFENSKAAVFRNLHNGIGAGTTELHVARPYGSTIDPFFILYCLKSPGFLIRGEARMTGTAGQKRLPKDFFATDPIPLPPLAEQHRIVQKVDELMALCDRLEQQTRDQHAAHETLVDALLDTLTQSQDADELADNWARLAAHFDTLFTSEQSVERLKRSVIQLAISGRLTNQAGNTEPPAVLLDAIAEQRESLVQLNKIRKPAQSRRSSKSAELFSLPKGWQWGVLEDLFAIVTDGDHQAPPKSASGIPFLTIGNVNTGSINFHGCRHVPSEYYESLDWARRPGKNDLLYTVTGSYGISAPVTSHKAFCVQRHIAILKSVDATPIPYVLLFLRSQLAFDYVERSVTGIAQKTLSLSALRKMPIPIPPLEEQERLVKQSDKLMMLCDQIKAHVKQAGESRRQMAEAVVEQAIH
ncbi:restriction endonuclease subunit S [Salinisphaera sp. LB1]|uniref:restriction endonuclease subunit S n=1 Tax=Salinisphaera sp. LB1 TaxID=2183911 RepID=UPI000D707E60|nr:restriction endonuclease subunit S [Salinisphaera sp. LB1]AWN15326.1 Type I restriction-modification system, specificity subunit S [Salinisphaera sp. LB1]